MPESENPSISIPATTGVLAEVADPPYAPTQKREEPFVAIADDATAAASNPAGLINLLAPEVSTHLRVSTFGPIFSDSTLDFVEDSDTVVSPAFASVVWPALPGKLSFSAFYQQLANSRRRWEVGDTELSNIASFSGIIHAYGVSAALRLGPVAIGLSGGGNTFNVDSKFEVWNFINGNNFVALRVSEWVKSL